MADNSEITIFAKTNFRDQGLTFGIKRDDRRRHMYLIGKTGMGKSTLIENLVYSDIVAGNGLCLVDPHGDTVEKMIRCIPNERINDVVYINPADLDFPVAFNVLEKVDPKYRHLVASGIVGVFKKLWADSWGPRLEYLLRNSILALLDYPDSTLLGVNRMLVDKDYRDKVVAKVKDPVVKAFWMDEFTKYNQAFMVEAIAPIQNKVGQFLSTSLIRNVVGQVKSTIDMRKFMDEGKIVMINLSKGRIGEDSSSMLGAMIITKIQLAAMSRVDVPEKERKDFYLYVDEFQNFSTESFANILSEARKYRLNLIVAHQYIEQLDEKVSAAIFGNVGTFVVFRVGAADAEVLVKEFEPFFVETDLVNLPKYQVYLKLMIDGVASDPFSATALPPIAVETGNDEKVINVSRERYGRPREMVEDKITRWSGIETEETMERAEQQIVEKRLGEVIEKPIDFLAKIEGRWDKDDEAEVMANVMKTSKVYTDTGEEEKLASEELYIVPCNNCGTKTKISFKPDGSRPVLCKECLKDYRRKNALAENVRKSQEARRGINATSSAEPRFAPRLPRRDGERSFSTPRRDDRSRTMSAPRRDDRPRNFNEPRRDDSSRSFSSAPVPTPELKPVSLSDAFSGGVQMFSGKKEPVKFDQPNIDEEIVDSYKELTDASPISATEADDSGLTTQE